MDVTKEQILVVDDEEDLRQAIVEILTVDGFDVHGVASAEEAQEMLSQTAYDVLITDNNLPGKQGVELLEETLTRYPETVGIVITASSSGLTRLAVGGVVSPAIASRPLQS